MNVRTNHNVVEVPGNDTNHCLYCKERLGKRFIIESSKFYCNIDCLRGYLSFLREYDFRKNEHNVYLVNIIYAVLGVLVLILTIRTF